MVGCVWLLEWLIGCFVFVADNKLGAEGGAAIGRALGECKGLTSVNMSGKDEGG